MDKTCKGCAKPRRDAGMKQMSGVGLAGISAAREWRMRGVAVPAPILGHADVAYVLNQSDRKLRLRDVKEAI